MPDLDNNGGYVFSALAITIVVLVGYALYLRSRLTGLRRRASAPAEDYSARNVRAAAPMPPTAHTASSANGPSTS
jgi:CcmD family protein